MKMIELEKMVEFCSTALIDADNDFLKAEQAFDIARDPKVKQARGYEMQIANGKMVAYAKVLDFARANTADIEAIEKPVKGEGGDSGEGSD